MCGALLLSISLTGWNQKHFVSPTLLISPHNYLLYSCAVILPISPSFTSIILVVARRSLVIVYLGRNTRLASSSHPRIDRYNFCFFPYTANLWNSLSSSVFPSYYNLSSFKFRVYRHLRGIYWFSNLYFSCVLIIYMYVL